MEFKGVLIFFGIAIVICSVQGLPRDSSVVRTEEVTQFHNEIDVIKKPIIAEPTTTEIKEVKIPGHVSCAYVEPIEDPVCQELCLPKGYSYGLCVGHKCSCI